MEHDVFTADAERLLRTSDAGELIEALSATTSSPCPLLFEGVDIAVLRRRLVGVRVNTAALFLEAKYAAMECGHGFIGPEHLLLGLAHQRDVGLIMEEAGFNSSSTRVRLAALVGSVVPDVRSSMLRTAVAQVRRWARNKLRRH